MATIIDTSLWIDLLRDKTGTVGRAIDGAVGGDDVAIIPPIRMEVLQGCRGLEQWRLVKSRIDALVQFPIDTKSWEESAKIYFDLKQGGWTARSSLDCLIAQITIQSGAILLHDDRDFETIATVCPLKHRRISL